MTARDNNDFRLDDDTRQDAVEVLRDCAQWRLSPARWTQVDAILGKADAALRTADLTALIAAVDELALASPFRVSRISKPEADQPVSPARQERLNRLVHALDTPPLSDDPADRTDGPG